MVRKSRFRQPHIILLALLVLVSYSVHSQSDKKQSKKAAKLEKLKKYYEAANNQSWVFQATNMNSNEVQSVTNTPNSASTPTQINPGSNWTIADEGKIILNYNTISNSASSSVGALANTGTQQLSAYIEEVIEYKVVWEKENKPIYISIRGRGTKPYNPALYSMIDKVDFDIVIYSNGKANATVRAGARGGTLSQYQGNFFLYDEAPITRTGDK